MNEDEFYEKFFHDCWGETNQAKFRELSRVLTNKATQKALRANWRRSTEGFKGKPQLRTEISLSEPGTYSTWKFPVFLEVVQLREGRGACLWLGSTTWGIHVQSQEITNLALSLFGEDGGAM